VLSSFHCCSDEATSIAGAINFGACVFACQLSKIRLFATGNAFAENAIIMLDLHASLFSIATYLFQIARLPVKTTFPVSALFILLFAFSGNRELPADVIVAA
jgi:hypothetical protein